MRHMKKRSKKKGEQPKMYIVKKYVKAKSAMQAIRKERSIPVHDVWVDDTWAKTELAGAIGFEAGLPEVDDDDL